MHCFGSLDLLRARSRKLNWHRSRRTRLKSEKRKEVLHTRVIMVAVTIECSHWVDGASAAAADGRSPMPRLPEGSISSSLLCYDLV